LGIIAPSDASEAGAITQLAIVAPADEADLLHGEVEREDTSFLHSMKVPAVGSGDLSVTQSLGDRDHGRIDGAEGKVCILLRTSSAARA
jgi:hypothetical protein